MAIPGVESSVLKMINLLVSCWCPLSSYFCSLVFEIVSIWELKIESSGRGLVPFKSSKLKIQSPVEEQTTAEIEQPGMKSEKFMSADTALRKQHKMSVLQFWKRGSAVDGQVVPIQRTPVIPSPEPHR